MWIDQRGSEILAAPECLRLLALVAKEDHIGRLAVTEGPSPLVVPLNFTYHDKGVFLRIGPGRLLELASGSMVSYEVDRVELDQGHAWSILIRGLASVVQSDTRPGAADLPQPLVPNSGDVILVIRPDVVTGRRFPLVARNGESVTRVVLPREGSSLPGDLPVSGNAVPDTGSDGLPDRGELGNGRTTADVCRPSTGPESPQLERKRPDGGSRPLA
jgi:hypothetical protein